MDYSILPPELLILLAFKANIKIKDKSDSQIPYLCYASKTYIGIKQYYFPVKILTMPIK